MYTLFIDTHYLDIVIILLKDGILVNKKEVINKKNNSEYIFPTIVDVIDDIKLNEIIVVNGPGSFTGVRLGVTIAKTFAYILNIPIKTITSLEVMAISSNQLKVAFSDSNGYYIGNFVDGLNSQINNLDLQRMEVNDSVLLGRIVESVRNPKELIMNTIYYFIGRQTGVLFYAPFIICIAILVIKKKYFREKFSKRNGQPFGYFKKRNIKGSRCGRGKRAGTVHGKRRFSGADAEKVCRRY